MQKIIEAANRAIRIADTTHLEPEDDWAEDDRKARQKGKFFATSPGCDSFLDPSMEVKFLVSILVSEKFMSHSPDSRDLVITHSEGDKLSTSSPGCVKFVDPSSGNGAFVKTHSEVEKLSASSPSCIKFLDS